MARPREGALDILVLGGGVVGLSCAVVLAQRGHRLTVLEPDARHQAASWGNAGHIATEQVAPLASWATLRSAWGRRFAAGGAMDLPLAQIRHWLPFALSFLAAADHHRFEDGCRALGGLLGDALPAWRRLAASVGQPEILREEGHFVLWESPASAQKGRSTWAAADTGTAVFRDATADELAAITRLTGRPLGGGIRFAGSAQIADLPTLARALEAALAAAGGRLLHEAGRLVTEGGRASVPGHPADLVLVAAGARSAPLVRALGHKAPLIAERGYHIRTEAGLWPADMPPLVFEDRSMIVTRFGHEVQASSFVEFGDADAPADPRKWLRLEAHMEALGLPTDGHWRRWLGARPTLPDYLPAIGRSSRAGNMLYAFGHQHLGLTLAATTAELVAALAEGREPAIDISPFRLERFG